MGFLNEDVAYSEIATSQSRDVFLPDATPSRELLQTGTRLCFFTSTLSTSALTAQWWIFLNPFLMSNHTTAPGIGEFLYQSGCRIDRNHQLVAPQGVKVRCAEPRSRFVIAALTKPVFGYVGLTRNHRAEPNGGAMPLPGGEFRVWIPELSAQHIQLLPIPRKLQYVAAEIERAAQEAETEQHEEHADSSCE